MCTPPKKNNSTPRKNIVRLQKATQSQHKSRLTEHLQVDDLAEVSIGLADVLGLVVGGHALDDEVPLGPVAVLHGEARVAVDLDGAQRQDVALARPDHL